MSVGQPADSPYRRFFTKDRTPAQLVRQKQEREGHMFCFEKEISPQPAGEGCTRRILAVNQSQMLVEVRFEKGAVGADHTHPHQQITYVLEGRFEARCAGQKAILGPGDTVTVPAGALHGMTALEQGVLLDIFTPIREDFLK